MNTTEFKNRLSKKTFIIAELSANHNHDIEIAIKTIRAAKKSGADAIKIQTYTADTLTIDCDNDYFKIKGGSPWDGKTLYELYQEAYTPWEWHQKLKKAAEEEDLIFFSTPFDKSAVDFLEELNVPIYKIASFEITDIPLIEYVATKEKPIILSTGIATMEEIHDAVDACKRMGNMNFMLLKCTSSYPAPLEEANLATIPDMAKIFGCVTGLSDHTIGDIAATTAVALGAKIIEKHFILDRAIGGPDALFSMEPGEFKSMVEKIRMVEKTLGTVTYEVSPKVQNSRVFARSLFVVEDIKEGEAFTEKNIRSIRPGYGLSPKFYHEIIGKRAKQTVKKGTPLQWEHIE